MKQSTAHPEPNLVDLRNTCTLVSSERTARKWVTEGSFLLGSAGSASNNFPDNKQLQCSAACFVTLQDVTDMWKMCHLHTHSHTHKRTHAHTLAYWERVNQLHGALYMVSDSVQITAFLRFLPVIILAGLIQLYIFYPQAGKMVLITLRSEVAPFAAPWSFKKQF